MLNKRDINTPRTPTDVERRVKGEFKNKVDKEKNKGLSSNDFTDQYKENCDSNTQARHNHINMSVLNSLKQQDLDNLENLVNEKQLYTLFTGENKNVQLSDSPTNYDLVGISYGNGTVSDTKFILPTNNVQFYISLNTSTTNEEKSLCTINGNTLTSESINILKVIGFKFRKGVVQNGGN